MQLATDCKDCELVVGAFKEMLHKALFRTIERVSNSCDFSKRGLVMCFLNVLKFHWFSIGLISVNP